MKDKYFWWGSNSWWCRFWRIFKLYRFCLYRPTPPIPPPPKYIEIKICLTCGNRATPMCAIGAVGWGRYLKGNEPKESCIPAECCKIPPPSPVVYPDPIPIMGFQGVGGFNYFKITRNGDETLKLLKEIRMHGYYLNDGFMFLSDNEPHHKNLTYSVPWLFLSGKFDLGLWRPSFWIDFKNYLEIHKEVGLDFCPQLWMRKDYINYPFKNNVNGVTDFWDKDAMPYHRAYARKVMDTFVEVYGKQYNPYVKIMNEVAHHGEGKKYHQIMYFHEDIVENILMDYTTLSHIICDLTGCEGTLGELREPHNCPKKATCDRNGRHGKPEHDRLAVGEKHKYSTWADFSEIKRFVNSANKARRFTEDGGGRAEDGKYTVSRTGMKLGNPEQQGYMMKQLALIYKATKKKVIFCSFPHTALKKIDGVFYPDYRVSEMTRVFSCAKAMKKAYEAVLKEGK